MGKKRSINQAKRKRSQRKKQRSRPVFYVILTTIVIVGAIWGGIELLRQQDEALAGTRVDLIPAGHVPGCTPRYNSTPPTSGCHQGSSAPWMGVSDSPIANELQVHNLEHGGVMVQYRPNPVPGLSDEYIEDLAIFVREIRTQSRYCKVILAPYPGLDQTIALTSWGWIETFEEFDHDDILKFIDDHLEKGPEQNIPCR